MIVLDVIFLLGLWILPSWLLAECFVDDEVQQDAFQAILLVVISSAPALLLHVLGIPIQRLSLALCQSVICILAIACYGTMRRRPSIPRSYLFLFGLIPAAVLIFPYTNFTGIDTYKWQDLATAIRLEQHIPWLIHPVGLFGFLPRSYPSLQPVILANTQILANLGVDGGFRIFSLLVLWVGFMTSRCWFASFTNRTHATICAFVYVTAPVFVRYSHWATGRGLFLALFPALLYLLTHRGAWLSKNSSGSLYSKWILWFLALILISFALVMSHKVAWVALLLILFSSCLARWFPRNRMIKTGAIFFCLVIATLIANRMFFASVPGKLAGMLWSIATRFSWLFPAALIAWLVPHTPLYQKSPFSRWALLLCIPLALDPQMYGALIALPLIVAYAVPLAIDLLMHERIRPYRSIVIAILITMFLLPSIVVVISRSVRAIPDDIKTAAIFLDQHDPTGPSRVHAPGLLRNHIQAYVSGCPRFTLSGNPKMTFRLPSPPDTPLALSRDNVFTWTAWLRNIIAIEGLQVSWYGDNPTHYIFVTQGGNKAPQTGTCIYDSETVKIYQR